MFPRESFHYFLNAPKMQFSQQFVVSHDEIYSLNLFHILNKDQSDGIFHLLSNGVTSIISLQMREKSTDEVKKALESLANQSSGYQNNETCFSVFQAHQTDDQPIFTYAINAFSVYWKPTAKILMLNFSIKHLMALTNGVPIIADLQIDTYNEEPDRYLTNHLTLGKFLFCPSLLDATLLIGLNAPSLLLLVIFYKLWILQ